MDHFAGMDAPSFGREANISGDRHAQSSTIILGGPRIIATDRQAPRIYPRMIRLCSRFNSVLFTPKMSAIPSYGNYSRSP